MNWAAARVQFPALERFTYLNTATYGQMPVRSRLAVERHFARRDELACSDFLSWFDDVDGIRALIGQLIGCAGEDIAFAMNAAAALSLLLRGMEWRAGDRIVTLQHEFPNQYYLAATLAAQGVELMEWTPGEALPARTRAVLASTVNYANGYRPDMRAISELAHAAGALLYVDGTQSVGALRFDVAEVKPDVFAVDPYKWLLAPNGATFYYVSPELRKTLQPAVMGWRSDRGWRGVDELNHGAPVFEDGARKYEGGMLNFPSLYGLAESVRMMLEIGPDVIENRVLELAGKMAEMLRETGASIVHENTQVVAAHWEDREAPGLAKKLQERRIVVAARHGNLRVSPHFYNNEADLLALIRNIDV